MFARLITNYVSIFEKFWLKAVVLQFARLHNLNFGRSLLVDWLFRYTVAISCKYSYTVRPYHSLECFVPSQAVIDASTAASTVCCWRLTSWVRYEQLYVCACSLCWLLLVDVGWLGPYSSRMMIAMKDWFMVGIGGKWDLHSAPSTCWSLG